MGSGPGISIDRFGALSISSQRRLRAIYEEAFPAWQRVPFGQLLKQSKDPSALMLALIDGSEPTGLAVVVRLTSVPWWYLEYLSIERSRRGQGLGSRLWDAMTEELPDHGRPMVLEVEAPEETLAGSDERRTRERRIEFYGRYGAVRLPVPNYHVPFLTGTGIGRLSLLAIPAPGSVPPESDALRDLVRAVLVDGYQLPADASLVMDAVRSVP
jgi:Acetyltransferase (GNAT) family.